MTRRRTYLKYNIMVINPNRALTDMFKSVFERVYVINYSYTTFMVYSFHREKLTNRFIITFNGNKMLFLLVKHFLFFIFFLRFVAKIDVLVLSQVLDYPLHILFLAKLRMIKIVDFIGGARYRLSSFTICFSSSTLRKIKAAIDTILLLVSIRLCDKVVLICKELSEEYPFNKFKRKLVFALNFPSKLFYKAFRPFIEYEKRELCIGYVGKFTLAKGVLNFSLAVAKILSLRKGVKIFFVGDYVNSEPTWLGIKIRKLFKDKKEVTLTGHVPSMEIPKYMNELKLLVLASYTEGVPHVVLEAMACGTPVLTSPVGALSCIIKEGYNGFLLKKLSPDYIAHRVLQLLENEDLLRVVSINASKYVRETYSFLKSVTDWVHIICSLFNESITLNSR